MAKNSLGVNDIVSGKGNTLQELAHQLHHPASQARISALRGFQDILLSTSSEILQSHLSTLLPIISKCACVDEDDDVRQLGLQCLEELLNKFYASELRPFCALLTAFVTSALNSLDRSTRMDGARAVKIISTSVELDNETVAKILPAYAALMQDHAHYSSKQKQQQTDTKKAKKKKKHAANDNEFKRLIVPKSLLSLLQTTTDTTENIETNQSDTPDAIIKPGGISANALLVVGPERNSKGKIKPISSITDLASGEDDDEETASPRIPSIPDLVLKLRDAHVEVAQRGIESTNGEGIDLLSPDLEEISLLLCSIHRLCKTFGAVNKKSFKQVLAVILEAFPISPRNPLDKGRYENANGEICFAVMDIASTVGLEASKWVTVTLDYIQPRMKADSTPEQAFTSINVLAGLLMLRNNKDSFELDDEARKGILEKVCETYFRPGLDQQVMRSTAGRKSTQLLCEILEDNQYQISASDDVSNMLKNLPAYLHAWGNDFPVDSARIVDVLHEVFRRITSDYDEVLATLRAGLLLLFEFPKKRKSIFESFGVPLQRKVISLLVILGSPSEDTFKALGRICSRAGIADEEADYVMECMFLERRSVPIHVFLQFVLNGIGLSGKSVGQDLCRYDRSVVRAVRTLRRCGIDKVVPLILPSLLSWLDLKDDSSLLRFRAALQIIASAALEHPIFSASEKLVGPLLDSLLVFFGSSCTWKSGKSDLYEQMSKPLVVCTHFLNVYLNRGVNLTFYCRLYLWQILFCSTSFWTRLPSQFVKTRQIAPYPAILWIAC